MTQPPPPSVALATGLGLATVGVGMVLTFLWVAHRHAGGRAESDRTRPAGDARDAAAGRAE